jgi:hypothetical protein
VHRPVPLAQLKYNTALACFKNMLKGAGLCASDYGLHSPRVGAATEAYASNVPGHIIDIRGRWKSAHSKKRYCRPPEQSWIRVVSKKLSKFD